MGIHLVDTTDQWVEVKNVLISVSDKRGLDRFVPHLLSINSGIRILSTGGTYDVIKRIAGEEYAQNLIQVSDYTGQPETQGGLVKTLDFKIYLGLLTETYNPSHLRDLERTRAVPIDMVVVNLYPFQETVAGEDVTFEKARGNIDIGGPCMIRAAAKNFLRVAPVVDPGDYEAIIETMRAGSGRTNLALRYRLAQKAFAKTAEYDGAIASHLAKCAYETDVAVCYNLR
ncbi:MAG: hypothetical protein ACOZF0_00085 [Thermodesulfobacteriota bacterium]